jgi:hypothetical protein
MVLSCCESRAKAVVNGVETHRLAPVPAMFFRS